MRRVFLFVCVLLSSVAGFLLSASYEPARLARLTSPMASPPILSRVVAKVGVDPSSQDDFISAATGYEYVHPSVSALLLTEPSQKSLNAAGNNNTDTSLSERNQLGEEYERFGVDPKSYTLQLNSQCYGPNVRILSIQELADLAERCDNILFKGENSLMGVQSNGGKIVAGLPDKISGLICLSQLHSCYLLRRNDYYRHSIIDQTNHSDKNIKTERDPGVLLATMVALNLLESSIRNIIKRYEENASIIDQPVDSVDRHARIVGKRKKQLDTSTKKGAPLLKNMIEQLSALGNPTGIDINCNKKRKSDEFSNSTHIAPPSSLAPILRALLLPTRSFSKCNLKSKCTHDNNLEMLLDHNLTGKYEITGGLNLRNLVSHGFLSTVERRWFSLCVVLIQTLEASYDEHNMHELSVNEFDQAQGECASRKSPLDSLSPLTKYKPMACQVKRGQDILLGNGFYDRMQQLELQSCRRQIDEMSYCVCEVKHLVPDSHRCFLKFVLFGLAPSLLVKTKSSDDAGTKETPSIPSLPTIFVTAMSALLEHSLRLLWCSENQRYYDCIARASEYYVTLDGHGQRDRHDVMISPILRDGKSKNKLISLIGAPEFAMLSDLFASPSPDAPNIRSAVFHGTLDDAIVTELEELGQWALHINGGVNTIDTDRDQSDNNNSFPMDASCALISCLDLISRGVSGKSKMSEYEPVYSYTAMAKRDLDDIFRNLDELDSLISNNVHIANCVESMEKQKPKLCKDIGLLRVDPKILKEMVHRVFPTMVKDPNDIWTIKDVFVEHNNNIVLSNSIAAQKLLSDISRETKAYVTSIRDGMNILSLTPTCTKDKRALRAMAHFCGVLKMTVDFCSFSVYVALLMVMVVDRDTFGMESAITSVIDDATIVDLHRNDVVKAAERTRMTISTYCSFIATNLDRSTKALQQFLQGKAIKKVIGKMNHIK